MENNITSAHYLSDYTSVESIILATTLICIMTVSIIGGITMLYILYNNDKMWNSNNMLIGNLAFTCFWVTILVMPFSLLSVIKGEWTFGEGHVCKLTGFAASLLLLATIFTHTMISLDKYFAVVKPLSRVMTVGRTAFIIAVIWAMASTMSFIPLAGIARYEYNPTTLICGVGFPRRRMDLLYLLTLSGVGFVLPITIMTYMYTRVYFAVKQHTARLLAHSVISTDALKLQKKLILTVFASLICFLLCWSTFCALTVAAILVKDASQLPRGLGVAAYWTGYLNSALNPVIICTMSNRFKEGTLEMYRDLFGNLRTLCSRNSLYLDDDVGKKSNTQEIIELSSYGTYTQKTATSERKMKDRHSISICIQKNSDYDHCMSDKSNNCTSSHRCTVNFSEI